MKSDSHGALFVVGLGPGSPGAMTPDAASALDRAEVVVGYRGYLDLIADRIAGKVVVGRDLGQEVDRADAALSLAESGRIVALVSSGDAGVYAMAGVALELAAARGSAAEVSVIPGITAALSSAALLGAPLAHDWACVSLSDLLTPWDVIVDRVSAAARADFALVFYNPRSRTRTWQLPAVAEVLSRHRSPDTPVGLVENAYREGQRVEIVRLSELASACVTMFTTVIVGSSRTIVDRGRMITPRIYAAKAGHRPSDSPEPPEEREPRSGDAGRARPVIESAPEHWSSTTDGTRIGPHISHPKIDPASPGEAIMAESLAIIDREMGASPRARAERAIVRRMIHASADFDYESNARFHRDPIDAAISALRTGRPVLTDVEMLRAGIRRDLAGPLGVEVLCALDEPGSFALAASGTLTRSAAGMRRLAERAGHGAIVAVGNAPTAVMEALRLIDGGWRPGCLVAIPVGFVGVEEAKRAILSQELVPAITSVGRKGGTAVTAAAVNALMELAAEARSP